MTELGFLGLMALESTFQSGTSKQLCKESNDIISNLPLQVTECILEHLPFHHVVRMSILSRHWRYKWVILPHIILDQTFFDYVLKRFKNTRSSEASQAYSDIINNILLRHIGRIDKFVLSIPSWFPLKADLSQWLQFVSRHGIKEFALVNNNHGLSPMLPSCLYSFETLTQLTLFNCHLNLPPTFKGFPHLKFMELELGKVSFGALEAQMLENLISLCSRLQNLELCIIGSKINLTICAPELQEFAMKGIVSSLSLKATTNIKSIAVNALLLNDAGLKSGCLLNCQMLVLDRLFWLPWPKCKCYYDLIPPEKLGKELEALQILRLLNVPLNCNYAVPFILCLFRCSPHLQRLFIYAVSDEICSRKKSVQNKGNFTLPCLKHVEFVFKASVELELIKLLLACSPALEVMTIVLSETLSAEEKLEIAKELMRYGRASPNAEIILKP